MLFPALTPADMHQWRNRQPLRTPCPFHHHLPAGRRTPAGRGKQFTQRPVIILVRRIQQHEIESGGGVYKVQRMGQPAADHRAAIHHAAALQIRLDEGHGPRVLVDERHAGRSATERLQPQRTGPRATVQDVGVGHRGIENVEQGLLQAIRCRPQPGPGRRRETTSLQSPSDDCACRLMLRRPGRSAGPTCASPGRAAAR